MLRANTSKQIFEFPAVVQQCKDAGGIATTAPSFLTMGPEDAEKEGGPPETVPDPDEDDLDDLDGVVLQSSSHRICAYTLYTRNA